MDSSTSHYPVAEFNTDLQIWELFPQKKEENMSKNFKVGYQDFDTQAQAEQAAKRQTAKSFDTVDIWQRIATTVVPDIDVQINSTAVTVEAVS